MKSDCVQWINKGTLPFYPGVLPVCLWQEVHQCRLSYSTVTPPRPPTSVTPWLLRRTLPPRSRQRRLIHQTFRRCHRPAFRGSKIATNLGWMVHPSERGGQQAAATSSRPALRPYVPFIPTLASSGTRVWTLNGRSRLFSPRFHWLSKLLPSRTLH